MDATNQICKQRIRGTIRHPHCFVCVYAHFITATHRSYSAHYTNVDVVKFLECFFFSPRYVFCSRNIFMLDIIIINRSKQDLTNISILLKHLLIEAIFEIEVFVNSLFYFSISHKISVIGRFATT